MNRLHLRPTKLKYLCKRANCHFQLLLSIFLLPYILYLFQMEASGGGSLSALCSFDSSIENGIEFLYFFLQKSLAHVNRLLDGKPKTLKIGHRITIAYIYQRVHDVHPQMSIQMNRQRFAESVRAQTIRWHLFHVHVFPAQH